MYGPQFIFTFCVYLIIIRWVGSVALEQGFANLF